MKGFYCQKCGKETPVAIKDGIMYFYCDCDGLVHRYAYFREISD